MFGTVISSMDTVDAIALIETEDNIIEIVRISKQDQLAIVRRAHRIANIGDSKNAKKIIEIERTKGETMMDIRRERMIFNKETNEKELEEQVDFGEMFIEEADTMGRDYARVTEIANEIIRKKWRETWDENVTKVRESFNLITGVFNEATSLLNGIMSEFYTQQETIQTNHFNTELAALETLSPRLALALTALKALAAI